MLFALFISWCSLVALALAAPVIVYNPPITYPTAGVVWRVGEKQTVTWDVTNLPNGTSPGMILLGYVIGSEPSEHLMIDSPLARGFPLSNAKADIIVPTVPERDDYIVVVFGDSGNASPKFTILGGSKPAEVSSAIPSPSPSADPTPSASPQTTPAPTTTATLGANSGDTISPAESPKADSPPAPTVKPKPVTATSTVSVTSAAAQATTTAKASSAPSSFSTWRMFLSILSSAMITVVIV